MANNSCTGDCLKCSFQQQVYCAAQRSYAMMENQRVIVERLDLLDKAIAGITTKSDIINLLEENKAQITVGADNRTEQPF